MKLITFNQFTKVAIWSRSISSSIALGTKEWRVERGLPVNRNAEGVLTDGPDYTFLDGRPTPLLHKQKLRMLWQRQCAEKIVEFCSELDFAKERYQKMKHDEEEERQRILNDRLKPKGMELYKKS